MDVTFEVKRKPSQGQAGAAQHVRAHLANVEGEEA